MQSEHIRARRSAHQHEGVDRGMSGSCEAVENDASDERDRPSRDDIERRVRQLIDELALTPAADQSLGRR